MARRAADLLRWMRTPARGGGPLDKARFIARYLRALADQAGDPGSAALREHALPPGRVPPSRGEWCYQGGDRPFLRRIAWGIDSKSPWKSFADVFWDDGTQEVLRAPPGCAGTVVFTNRRLPYHRLHAPPSQLLLRLA